MGRLHAARNQSALAIWECCRLSVPTKWQEEQAICCAGLTKPKPNVFQQAVQHILVVCTTVEVSPVQRPCSMILSPYAERKATYCSFTACLQG